MSGVVRAPAVTEAVANACAMFSAIDLVSANEMFDVTATTIPRSGNVRNDVEPPSKVRLAWLASRVGSPASGTVSSIQPRP